MHASAIDRIRNLKIVIMHAHSATDRHFSVSAAPLVLLVGAALVAAATCGALLQRYLSPRLAAPHAETSFEPSRALREAAFVRENVNLLASRLGTLQAKAASIDGLGRRVAAVVGLAHLDPELSRELAGGQEARQVMDEVFTDRQPPAEGVQSAQELGRQLDEVQKVLARQADNLKLLDAALTKQSAAQARLPTTLPVTDYPYLSSSYGWRRHPITGRYTMHEGLDFAAPPGTPILAAAGGVVTEAKYHGSYGNMVEIDHGDGLLTRYAHASSLLVRPGELVERGQPVARVGKSGRSTGSHLHFEVRLAGHPVDPRLFLGPRRSAGTALAATRAVTARP